MKINLHIEQLVLDGVTVEPHQRAGLKAAVAAELAGSLAQNGMAAGLQEGSVRAVQGEAIQIAENNQGLGRQIARSIYGGIKG